MREAFKNRLVIQKKRVEEGIIDVFHCFADQKIWVVVLVVLLNIWIHFRIKLKKNILHLKLQHELNFCE
jgi:hypothetical protein